MTDLLLGSLLALLLLNGLMYLQQSSMIFIPSSTLEAKPSDWGLAYEEVSLRSADGIRLHGWYVPAPGADKVLLFFHGNAGNISHRAQSIAIFHRLGLNVFIIDYRGYGQSEGTPSEQGLYADARSAWDYLLNSRGVQPENVIVFGRSLGGAVAAQLASETQPGALILESTLSSAKDFARAAFPVLSRLVVMRFEFNTAQRMKHVQCPVLVLHSSEDEIMPYALGEKVYTAANEPKSFMPLRGDHNSGFMLSQPDYERSLERFIHAPR